MNKEQVKQVALTYFRAAFAAALALYIAGITDPKALLSAATAAVAAPLLKAVDPSAKEFGKKK
jgi:hypothetical protein